jgi:hypothetical protein
MENEGIIKRNPSMKIDKNYSYYLFEPELHKRHKAAMPNDLMYRYFPNENDIIIKEKNPKDNYRFIFNGMEKTPFEQEKLDEFYKFIKEKEKKKKIDQFLPDWWIESDTMRYLQASNYDIKKVYSLIKENLKSTENARKVIDKRIRYILNYGFIYMHGRDTHFRPILIIEVKRAIELMDKLDYTFEEISQSILFFMNYIVNYMLIPGQIENWILICDLKDVGLTKLPKFKSILSSLSKFRCRVIKNYILHLGSFIKTAASTILSLLGSASAKKIVVVDKKNLEVMQEFIRKENLQLKHGGLAPDVVYGEDNLFPPLVPSEKYIKDGEVLNIVTPEIYKEMCLESKPFKPFVINDNCMKAWEKEKEEKILNEKIKSAKSNSSKEICLNDFLVIFENTKNNNFLNGRNNKYAPKKIDVNNFKTFFAKMNHDNKEEFI